MEPLKHVGVEGPRGQGSNGRTSAVKAALQLPAGEVLIRKVRGPDGTHPWLGYVKTGRVYCLAAAKAAEFCGEAGEFEPVADYAAEVEAETSKRQNAETPKSQNGEPVK